MRNHLVINLNLAVSGNRGSARLTTPSNDRVFNSDSFSFGYLSRSLLFIGAYTRRREPRSRKNDRVRDERQQPRARVIEIPNFRAGTHRCAFASPVSCFTLIKYKIPRIHPAPRSLDICHLPAIERKRERKGKRETERRSENKARFSPGVTSSEGCVAQVTITLYSPS